MGTQGISNTDSTSYEAKNRIKTGTKPNEEITETMNSIVTATAAESAEENQAETMLDTFGSKSGAKQEGKSWSSLENYGTNTEKNIFIKEYIEKKAKAAGVELPEDFQIEISSPNEFSQEYKDLLKYVRKEIYGARLYDMFNLLAKNPEEVQERVSQMKIPDEDKQKILRLKEMFDDYYKIEAEFKGQRINLIDLSEEDIQVLEAQDSKLAKFVKEESENLHRIATDFTKKEIKNSELSTAGKASRYGAGILLPALGGFTGWKIWQTIKENKAAMADKAAYLAEQKSIYKAGNPKFVNPVKAFGDAIKNAKGGSRWAKIGAALLGAGVLGKYLYNTFVGSLDDCGGAVKDLVQDVDNFGLGTGVGIFVPSVIGGVLSSAFIAPTIESKVAYNRAENYLRKAGELPKIKGLAKLTKFAKGLIPAALFGVAVAASSSGSSWTSMIGTGLVFGKRGNDLEKKNIITKEENQFYTSAKNNMMEYEAYSGKEKGILTGPTGDPVIGGVGGGLGLFTHTNPFIQNIAFGIQGCSETLTSCAYQILGDASRESQLDKDKKELLDSIKE